MRRVRIIGGHVALERVRGGPLVFSRDYVLVHDPSGTLLDKCSLFVGPALLTDEPVHDKSDFDQKWYGSEYELLRAVVDVPDENWEHVAEVAEIVYWRPGKYESDFVHAFSQPQALYRSGRWHMLILPEDCEITWRGISRP